MRRAGLSAAAICAVAIAASAHAQTPAKQDRGEGERLTVNGCLSVNPAAKTYILTAKPDPMSKAAGGATTAPTTITYQLVGGEGLQNHVGARVEVTGRLEPGTKVTAESESETSGAPRNPQTGDKKPKIETSTETKIRAQVMRVEKFRAMEANCKPAG